MRLSADAERFARQAFGDAMPPIALRKPLQPSHLKMVLEMGAASLIPEHIANHSPQTDRASPPSRTSRAHSPCADPRRLAPSLGSWLR